MLVETMDNVEIKAEIIKDFDSIINTHERLASKYRRIRIEKRVDKRATFSYWFKLKSNRKNNWLVQMMKTPGEFKYDDQPEIQSMVYYLNRKGYRVFAINMERQFRVFNGHFFHRYSERKGIEFANFTEIVEHFFDNNPYYPSRFKITDSSLLIISSCNSGIMLGEFQPEYEWVVYKTFIDRTMNSHEQTEIEIAILEELQSEIKNDYHESIDDTAEHDIPFRLKFYEQLSEKYNKKQ